MSELIIAERKYQNLLREWFKTWSKERLIEEIEYLENLIGDDVFSSCIFADIGLVVYDFLRDECVSRIRQDTTMMSNGEEGKAGVEPSFCVPAPPEPLA